MSNLPLFWKIALAIIQGIDRYYKAETGRSLVRQEELNDLVRLADGKALDAQKQADQAHAEAESHVKDAETLKKQLDNLRSVKPDRKPTSGPE